MDDVALLYAGSGRNLLILLLSGLRDPASKVIFPEAVPFWHGNAIQGYTTRWDGRFGACSSDGRGGGWDERERESELAGAGLAVKGSRVSWSRMT